ncbi:MAG: hypothetical protein J1E34_08760 [Oscillospiraceae bacterium]|nr:hypothetical protein [Oscillospiraceae bacterium]
MRTKENLYPTLRIAALALLFLFTAAVQNSFLSNYSVPLVLLVPLTVSVCSFEGEFAGVFFGIAGGALYDIASPVSDGVFTLLFGIIGCAAGLIMRYVFRSTFLSVFLLTLAASLLTNLTSFVFTVILRDASNAAEIFLKFYLSGAFFTALILPVFYYPVKFLEARLKKL